MGSFTSWFERAYKVIIIVLLAIGASALVVLAMHQTRSATAADATAGPIPIYSSAPDKVAVSVLSDSHAFNADSWWRQTVAANKVPGVEMGQFKSTPGIDTERLAADVEDSTADGGWVIVQASTNELLTARSPEETFTGITALWDGVAAAGAKPIAALVPPSDKTPSAVIELNQLIRQEAKTRDIPILDV
ncbi:SGNH/GDSL hydrolase family protein [Curtobacterium flaccumfaciens]|uniref:SGNH/GDSL hydrolase family protein n=1 Tax=Curtobacterium flaccumfaciens TaxID=2035 RepID=UPI003EBD7EEE